ncbi:cytochrome P450 [Artemisia annua]|uniref:Cytochrome P450 n=1 Tax=Artemisia annua TaxID=35608 RepID=A0A2U1KS16_ARTAN|nr:cytochrome P450 [Artemisia annua]PWA44667.1 cytochrome P450 [Artemisia annua]
MELIAYFMENTLLSSFFFILTPFLLWFITNKYYNTKKNLPPGPPQLPIIGNLHQMGKKPHVSTAMFAEKYGPLISLRLGSQLLVVASSPEAAMEVLKTQDRVLSGRIMPDSFQVYPTYEGLVWAPECSEQWKILRTLCRVEIFSPKAIEAQSDLRNKKLVQMLDFLTITEGKVVKIEEVVFTTLFNTMSNILFSKDFLDLKGDHTTAHWLKKALQKTLENSMIPNVSDLFPIVRGLDLQGLRRDTLKQLNDVASFTGVLINERRDRRASLKVTKDVVVTEEKDFLDHLLDKNFTDNQINTLVQIFVKSLPFVYILLAICYGLVAAKRILKTSANIEKCDILKTELFIAETLRLHPVVPLLIPRRAVETCDVMGYTIPQDSQIWVNIWALSRDPKVWDEPNIFKPERFIGSHLNYTGQDFEFTPFGGGKRMCAGLVSGIKGLETMLASLILGFDWILPNGEDPTNLDMKEHFGVVLQKEKPLELIFKHKG